MLRQTGQQPSPQAVDAARGHGHIRIPRPRGRGGGMALLPAGAGRIAGMGRPGFALHYTGRPRPRAPLRGGVVSP
jgi:hypothetical protein